MSVIVQTSYSQRPDEAYLGQMATAFGPGKRTSRVARGLVKAGYGVFKVPGTGARQYGFPNNGAGEVFHIPNPGVAVSANAICTSFSSAAAGGFTVSAATMTAGTVGAGVMQPARKLTVTFDASLDWDPTSGTITYLDQSGKQVTEVMAIATSTTFTTTGYASQFVGLTGPAQTGATGTATIGIGAMPSFTIADFAGVAIRQVIKTTISNTSLYGYPGVASNVVTADYIDNEVVPLLREGDIWVFAETAMSEMDPVYVRVAANGANTVLGAFRKDSDTSNAVQVTGARVARDCQAGKPCWVRFSEVW